MSEQNRPQIYDAYYYAHDCGRPYQRDEGWLQFFGKIAERIVSDIQPASVLDAGCAWGFLVEALRQREVEAFGLDISEYAIQNVHEDIKPYCWVGSVTDPFPQKYDLIVSIEVLEHMPQQEAEKAIANFCLHTDQVLFSSTPFDYKEVTHFNVHPPEYWAELFARQGFFREVDFDASFITSWAVHFRRKSEPLVKMVREYERKFFLLWKENADLRSLTLEMQSKAVEMSSQLAATDEKVRQTQAHLEEKEQMLQKLGTQVADLDQEAVTARSQLNEILQSKSWNLIQRTHKLRYWLVPVNSRREKFLQKLGVLSDRS